MEPKRGRTSGAEPSWDISRIGSRQANKSRSQPPSEPEPPEPKLKSVIKSVRLSLPKLEDLESLGLATRNRYDKDPKEDRPQRERSRHRADTSVRPKDSPRSKSRSDKGSERSDHGTGRHDRGPVIAPVMVPAISLKKRRVLLLSCWPGKNMRNGLRK